MVEKLNLPRAPLESPYRAYGVSNDQWVDIKEKTYVSFSIGPYYDTIICDIMPLNDCHMILGRVWQVDVKALHDGRENANVINKVGKKCVMKSVQDDKAV